MRNIVLFGDSITYGYGVFKKDSIQALIQQKFKNYSIINSGLNGDTSRYALTRLEKDVLKFSPYAVTVLFGSNDCAPSEYGYVTITEFKSNIEKIIKTISNKCQNIILITPPPVDESVFMPYTTNARLLPYCEAIRDISKKYNCFLADFNMYITQKSNGFLAEYLQEDGCHISEKGYLCFFECLEPTLKKLL